VFGAAAVDTELTEAVRGLFQSSSATQKKMNISFRVCVNFLLSLFLSVVWYFVSSSPPLAVRQLHKLI